MEKEKEHAPPRRAGICLHLTSLPGVHGIGSIGAAARAFVRDLSRMQVGVWQFLPTGPTGFGNSPYQALSTFAGNELLIDIDALVTDGVLGKRDADPLADLPRDYVDFEKLVPLKTAILERAATRFETRFAHGLQAEFDAFLNENDATWLADYARFRVLKDRHRQSAWPHWERRFRRRHVRSLARLDREAVREIHRVKIRQFLFHRQWCELRTFARRHGVVLFGDLPIYVAADSADAWVHPDLLQMNRDGAMQAVAGVPPDYFGKDGQLWGNPLYRWSRHQAEDFDWWVGRLRHAMTLSDLVRIDHFRGFESFWSVPAGAPSARAGRWVRGPGDALFRVLESRLGRLPVIAEDLGVITPAVTGLRQRFSIPGMRVLQFALADHEFRLDDIGEDCVCYTGTHDNDTTIGWFKARGEDRAFRRRVLTMTGGSPETIHRDLFRLALQSGARLAVAPLQDVLGLGSEARLNLPGTDEGNWRWRMLDGALTERLIDETGELISASNRVGNDSA